MKVLIVDDAAIIRSSISKRVDWAALGLRVVGEAENGLVALEQIRLQLPDIVITDLHMPVADGFSFMEEARQRIPHIQFIIISGYDEFEYARNAIRHKAVSYLLKPIQTGELVDALHMAQKNIRALQQAQSSSDLIKKAYLRKYLELLLLRVIDYEACNRLCREKGVGLKGSFCHCILVNITEAHSRSSAFFADDLPNLMQGAAAKAFPREDLCVVRTKALIPALLLGSEDKAPSGSAVAAFRKQLAQTGRLAENRLFVSFAAGYPPERLRDCYDAACSALYGRFLAGDEPGLLPATAPGGKIPWYMNTAQELAYSMGTGQWETAKRLLLLLEGQLTTETDSWALRQVFEHLSTQLFAYHPEYPAADQDLFLSFSHWEEAKEHLLGIMESDPGNMLDANLLQEVVACINRDFTKPLKLSQLAEQFHINRAYLGQLLKKKTGLTFNQYLNTLRMNHAVAIMEQNRDMNLLELSNIIGYADYAYFSRVFKAIIGISPNDYRNAVRSAKPSRLAERDSPNNLMVTDG